MSSKNPKILRKLCLFIMKINNIICSPNSLSVWPLYLLLYVCKYVLCTSCTIPWFECNKLNWIEITWIDEIQNGETHGRVKLIESTPSCRKILSCKVWISFSLIFLFSMYIRVTYRESFALTALRGCERASPSIKIASTNFQHVKHFDISDEYLCPMTVSSLTREAVQHFTMTRVISPFWAPLRWRNRGDWTRSFIDGCFSGVPSISCSWFNRKWLSILLVLPVYVSSVSHNSWTCCLPCV
jgi:hypothetical protein